jgi:hypothetical protein
VAPPPLTPSTGLGIPAALLDRVFAGPDGVFAAADPLADDLTD